MSNENDSPFEGMGDAEDVIDKLKRLKSRKESQVQTYTTGGFRMGMKASDDAGLCDVTEAYVQDLRGDIALLGADIELMQRDKGFLKPKTEPSNG